VSSIKPEDQFTRWRSEYEADILVALASLAGERMFFDSDSSSGVSGDLDSATTVASYMEGYWGMGRTVSSSQAARRLEGGTPGGARAVASVGPGADRGSMPGIQKLADRIEDNLGALLVKAEALLRENERHVLAVAHALESHKTLSGEDITAVFEGGRGPLVDGDPYADDAFIDRLREYHAAAARAHHEHNQPDVPLPVATPAYAIGYAGGDLYGTNGNGTGSYLDGTAFGGNGNGSGSATGNGNVTGNGTGNGSGDDDVIEFGS
jgi:cell division protease FtsH